MVKDAEPGLHGGDALAWLTVVSGPFRASPEAPTEELCFHGGKFVLSISSLSSMKTQNIFPNRF